MSKEDCRTPNPECKYYETDYCLQSLHHVYWPRRNYTTPLEKRFRNLPENKELLPRCEHDELHATTEPPEKPSHAFMESVVYIQPVEVVA